MEEMREQNDASASYDDKDQSDKLFIGLDKC